jgi:hypothetical protein
MVWVLAHQGGWDELLWFSLPVVIVMVWLRWAEKRARDRQAETEEPLANMPDESNS